MCQTVTYVLFVQTKDCRMFKKLFAAYLQNDFSLKMVTRIVGKGEKAGHEHLLLFPLYFLKPFSTGLLKAGIVC